MTPAAHRDVIAARAPCLRGAALDAALSEIRGILEAGALVGGAAAAGLEHELSRLTRRHAVVTRSGMDALELLFDSLHVRGRPVYFPANCFAALPALARSMGAKPVALDIEAHTLAIAPGVAPPPAAMVVWVHHCGIVAPHAHGEIARLRSAGCFVVEDCAEVLFPAPESRGPGTWGDAALLSLGPTKPVPAPAGGAVLCDDAAQAADLAARRRHSGQEPRWNAGGVALRERRLDELSSSVALAQWRRLPEIRERFSVLKAAYLAAMGDRAAGLLAGRTPGPTWGRVCVDLDTRVDAPDAARILRGEGIEVSVMYERPWFEYSYLASGDSGEDWTELRNLLGRTLWLPLHENLAVRDVGRVVAALEHLIDERSS
jgi:dTDP-4-amino-4,6-dideoxygalactose transaminase